LAIAECCNILREKFKNRLLHINYVNFEFLNVMAMSEGGGLTRVHCISVQKPGKTL